MQRFRRRIRDCAADAAADHDGAPNALDIRSVAERADHVRDTVARVQSGKHFCRAAYGLKNHGDRSRRAVIVGDGQRHSFAQCVDAENNILSRPRFCGDIRRFDFHIDNLFVQLTL